MYKAENAQQPASNASAETFSQLLEKQGLTIPSLARKLDIDRLVIGELNAGRMRLPIHGRLLDALANALARTKQDLQSVLSRTLSAPALGNAKAKATPEVHQQSYEEVVLSSEMSIEKKNYWLGRDSPWTPGETSG
jgi:transcriptional regulator with XRE-family HTH domain